MSDINNNLDNNNLDNNNLDNNEFNLNDLENLDFENMDLKNLDLNNINTDDISSLLKNLGNSDNNLEKLINNFSSGDVGSIFKNFGDIISNQTNDNSNQAEINDDNTTEEFDIEDDEVELNLDKFFISSTGKNICDVLLDVKSELQNINETIKNTLNK